MLILTVCVWYAIVYESQLLRSYENVRLKITVESIIGLPKFCVQCKHREDSTNICSNVLYG